MNKSMQNPAINAEALRLYYLQQLGVSVYASRNNFADASIDANHEADLPTFPPMPAEAAVNVVTSAPRKLLLDDTDVAAGPAPPKAPDKQDLAAIASPPEESVVLAPFQLLFFMPEPRLAVAMQIPALAKPVLQETEARLLQNLLRWLGIKNVGVEGTLLNFRWPLPGMPAGDAQSAGRNLQVFLQQASSEHSLQHLLLLGQVPSHCLELAAAGQKLPYQCWATHSLAEMLAVPDLKREVWRLLLPLHGQL